jgi:DNA-binding transcriptional ArsR family regulator
MPPASPTPSPLTVDERREPTINHRAGRVSVLRRGGRRRITPTKYFSRPIRCAEVTTAEIQDGPFRIAAEPSEVELLAKYFRVLSDRSRLRILEALAGSEELSVGEIVERLEIPQPSVSNHLACLRWCGFVEARREHRTVYNRVADPRVGRLIELARELLSENEEHVASCRRA